jgi:hypothetical protein
VWVEAGKRGNHTLFEVLVHSADFEAAVFLQDQEVGIRVGDDGLVAKLHHRQRQPRRVSGVLDASAYAIEFKAFLRPPAAAVLVVVVELLGGGAQIVLVEPVGDKPESVGGSAVA